MAPTERSNSDAMVGTPSRENVALHSPVSEAPLTRMEDTVDAVLPRWLSYERAIVQELYAQQDGLLVLARGLGVQRLLAYFIRLYSSPKSLVLCLNVSDEIPLFTQLVLALGLDRKYLPKVLDAKSSTTEREQLYRQGGCFFVTSRVLVIDLLNKKIDAKMVTGLLVYDAHRVTETSIEAFIIRLFREENRNGFIKAFSDDTGALAGGFNKMEQVLKHLYVRHVMLFPRFHVAVHACLEKSQPDVYEIEVAFSPKMKLMQEAILVAMDATIKELQRSTKALDAAELTMDKALGKAFAVTIRRQLDPVWHKLSPKTKQLVGDLTTLKQLLSYLPRYDAISYYSFLLNHQTMNGQQRFPSAWLFTEAADRLVRAAKDRLFQIVDKKSRVPINPRRLGAASDAASVLKTAELEMVLEGNPKWDALVQILDEVRVEQQEEDAQLLDGQLLEGPDRGGGVHVLIMVKDERTCAQLREFLALGEKEMLRRRFGYYLLQREASIRKKGGLRSNLGAEQQLLLDAAAQFRASETAFQAQATHTVQAMAAARGTTSAKPGKGKKRMVAETTPSVPEMPSLGMSLEELHALTAVDDALARNKRQLLNPSAPSSRPSGGGDKQGLSLELLDRADQVVLCTYEQAKQHGHGASALLQDILPRCVILYDPDMAFIRELEVFHALQSARKKLEIYFMLYDESAEQQTYLSVIQREKKSFETLIHQKAHLMLPASVYDVPYHVKAAQQQTPQYSMDTRTTANRTTRLAKPGVKVVVDVREFRSALPSMLHKDGLLVQPVTLEIGDYILSPQICVERKSISDLFGSLNSGRLFNQAESMGRYYELPVLLIEFSQGKAFSLQDASEIGSEISASNIVSKLTLLVLHFPNLRILWSRSPHATVDLFKAIKKNQPEPDLEVAQAIGGGGGGGGGDGDEAVAASVSYYNTNSMDVLRKLPGINDHNYRKVIGRVKNLAELATLSLEELTELLGKVCAQKLHTFFHTGL
jgi:DNA excision repair protein ERCC-4